MPERGLNSTFQSGSFNHCTRAPTPPWLLCYREIQILIDLMFSMLSTPCHMGSEVADISASRDVVKFSVHNIYCEINTHYVVDKLIVNDWITCSALYARSSGGIWPTWPSCSCLCLFDFQLKHAQMVQISIIN